MDFLIVIYDFECWPNEVQDWWSRLQTLLPETSSSSCTFAASYFKFHDRFKRGKTLHLDLASKYQRYRDDLIKAKMRSLLEQSYRAGSLAEGLDDTIKDKIVSAARSFDGSFAATSRFLAYLFGTFSLSSRSAIERNISQCPTNEIILYREHIKIMAAKPQEVSLWATKALSWVMLAVRPLRIEELAVAVAIHTSKSSIPEIGKSISMDMKRDLETHLGGLVTIENRRVRIVSSLVKEVPSEYYAINNDMNLQLETDYTFTVLCLHYLTVILGSEEPKTWEKCLSSVSYRHQTREAREPAMDFLRYACQFWPTHFLRVEDPDNSLKILVANFLTSKVADQWFELHLLSNGLSSNPLASAIQDPKDAKRSTGRADSHEVEARSKASLIAGYIGLTSIMTDLIGNDKPACDLKVIHVRRGYSECETATWETDSRYYVACVVADGDDDAIKQLLQEHHERLAGYFPMHRAVLLGRLKTVETLFEELAEPMGVNENHQTPLHMAGISGSIAVTRFLVKKSAALHQTMEHEGKGIDVKDEDSQTALILATRMGHIGVARYLVESHADLMIQDTTGKTALHYAVLSCPQVVGNIVRENKATIHVTDSDGCTPLHVAARSGSEEAAAAILIAAKEGGRLHEAVDAVDVKHKTPLHHAAENGYTEVAQLLVDNEASDAEPEDPETESMTPAELSAEHGHLSTLKVIVGQKTETLDRLLVAASRAGQLLIVQYLLYEKRVSPDGLEEQADWTPLLAAVSGGHNNVVAMLLERNANPNREDSERKTPLHHAAEKGISEVVETLLKHNANVNAPDSMRYTPLHYAAEKGDVAIAELLIRYGSDVAARTQQGETPLHAAVASSEVVKLLLESDADVSSLDILDQTPLHMAARKRIPDSVRLLVRQGAKIDVFDDEGRAPVYYAITQNDLQMTKELSLPSAGESHDSMWRNLELAVQSSALDVLKFFMTKWPDAPTMVDSDRCTLLNLAATVSSVEVLNFLLDARLDIEHRGRWERTPLLCAIFSDRLENVRRLIERSANINCHDEDGRTPLYVAASRGSPLSAEAVSILLEANASIDETGPNNQTALFIAAYNGHVSIAKSLLDHGANVSLCGVNGWSPLHAAADNIEIVKLLVDSKADVNLQEDNLWTPMHLAAFWDFSDVVRILLEKGANPNLVNDEDCTPLHVALAEGKNEVAEILIDHNGVITVDISKADREGFMPIHLATENCSSEVVQKLVCRRVDYMAKTTEGLSCLDIAVRQNKSDNLAVLCNEDTPSALGTGWSDKDLVAAYWKAVEEESTTSVDILLSKKTTLLDELSDRGLNGLETSLYNEMMSPDCENLALLFLERGVDPFQRRSRTHMSGFELGFMSRVVVKMNFLDACLNRLPETLDTLTLGFRELRLASEIDKTNFWKKLEPLITHVNGETDQDGWNIHHFLHQADPRVAFRTYERSALTKTKEPRVLVCPPMWQVESHQPIISADGLEAYFQDISNMGYYQICLRSDHPFPPRELGLSYFEVRVEETVTDGLEKVPAPTIGIGLCGEYCNQRQAFPGWFVWSFGYHGDNGTVYQEQLQFGYGTGRTYGPGHTVGCGVDYNEQQYFFTLDGEVVFRRSETIIYRKLYPCIGHTGGPCKVKINFGASPFVWTDAANLYHPVEKEDVTVLPKLKRRTTGRKRDGKDVLL